MTVAVRVRVGYEFLETKTHGIYPGFDTRGHWNCLKLIHVLSSFENKLYLLINYNPIFKALVVCGIALALYCT